MEQSTKTENHHDEIQKTIQSILKLQTEDQNRILAAVMGSKSGIDHNTLFEQADLNKDGYISKTEFHRYLLASQLSPFGRSKHPSSSDASVSIPSRKKIYQYMLFTGLPFVGFGFLDNAIMLTAGDIIEVHLGSTLHLSTLAAAALGNTVSDVFGLGMGGVVTEIGTKLGLKDPKLTKEQLSLPRVRTMGFLSTVIGISIGCLLGMTPLLFMNSNNSVSNRPIEEQCE